MDIIGSRLHRTRIDEDWMLQEAASLEFDRYVGAVAPVADGGHVLAAGQGFLFAENDRSIVELAQPEAGHDDIRMNDGACDAPVGQRPRDDHGLRLRPRRGEITQHRGVLRITEPGVVPTG